MFGDLLRHAAFEEPARARVRTGSDDDDVGPDLVGNVDHPLPGRCVEISAGLGLQSALQCKRGAGARPGEGLVLVEPPEVGRDQEIGRASCMERV